MQNMDFDDLLIRYRSGNCSPEEQDLMEYYILFENISPNSLSENEIDLELDDIQQRLRKTVPVQKSFIRKLFDYRVAASILICFSIGIYLLLHTGRNNAAYDNDVAPGKNKAILTLANGKKISLTDAKNGKLASLPGMQISKTKDGQLIFQVTGSSPLAKKGEKTFNTIETPNGGQYMVCLPDGSKVWLNAASTLSFPTTFDVTRNVELSGEAYFEVVKDKKHPFVVKSKTQQVQVLGTHFNINSYLNEPSVNTTLLEGSVRVTPVAQSSAETAESVLLKPNQQAVNTGSHIGVKEIDSDNSIAWKSGRFTFNNEPLEVIMRRLSRWYDVKVSYQNEEMKQKTFGGSTSRYSNISDVLHMLELTGEVKFKVKGKEITVMN
jgi:transmembrane sensor